MLNGLNRAIELVFVEFAELPFLRKISQFLFGVIQTIAVAAGEVARPIGMLKVGMDPVH